MRLTIAHYCCEIFPPLRRLRPDLPVLVRARDDTELERLLAAGAPRRDPRSAAGTHTQLRAGDVLILYGALHTVEHAEGALLRK